MKQYKWLSKRLISGVLVSVMLAVTTSVGLGTSLSLAADNPAPETEWEKTFGGSGTDSAYSVEQTTDGGYIIAGTTDSYGAGVSDVYLVKANASGNTEWRRHSAEAQMITPILSSRPRMAATSLLVLHFPPVLAEEISTWLKLIPWATKSGRKPSAAFMMI